MIFNARLYLYLIYLFQFFMKSVSFIFLCFFIILLVFAGLRDIAFQYGGYLLTFSFLLRYISKKINNEFVPIKIKVTKKEISFQKFKGKYENLLIENILHVDENITKFLKLKFTNFTIYTFDKKYKIKLNYLRNSNELESYLLNLSEKLKNVYVKNAYYKNTLMHSINQIFSTYQGKIGGFILVIYSIMTIIGALAYVLSPPEISGYKTWILFNPEYILYFVYDETGVLEQPNGLFWFGTDYIGRDIFSRMIYGTTITISIAIVGSLLVTTFITFFGMSSGIIGGTYDALIMRISEVLLTFPQVVWIILISVFSIPLRIGLPGGYFLAIYIGMSFVMWPYGAKIIRAEVLDALAADYINAIKLVGAGKWWIVKVHVFPKIIPTLFLLFFYQLSDIIIGISLIGYLGFDSESTLVWGSDLAKAFLAENIADEWWTILFPSLFIFGIVFGITLFSDSLRDIYASKFQGTRRSTLYSAIKGDDS